MLNGFLRSWTMDCAKRPMIARLSACTSSRKCSRLNSRRRLADQLQQIERQGGRTFDEREHFAARDEMNPRVHERHRDGRTRQLLDDRHFAENFPGAEPGKDPPGVAAHPSGNLDRPFLYKINPVAGRTLAEDFRAGGELPFLRDKPQRLQFLLREITEQGDGFKFDHESPIY